MNNRVDQSLPPREEGASAGGVGPGVDLEGVLDVAALEQLWDILGDDLKGIADAFCEQVPPQIDELDGWLAKGELDRIARCAHSIKGSAANLSAVRLSAAAARVEQAAKEGDLGAARQSVAAVRSEAPLALQALGGFVLAKASQG